VKSLNGEATRRPARSLLDCRQGPAPFLDVRRFELESANGYPISRQAAMMTFEPRKDRTDG
jgi:hypothetical protein